MVCVAVCSEGVVQVMNCGLCCCVFRWCVTGDELWSVLLCVQGSGEGTSRGTAADGSVRGGGGTDAIPRGSEPVHTVTFFSHHHRLPRGGDEL